MDTTPVGPGLDHVHALSASVIASCAEELAAFDLEEARTVIEAALDALVEMAVLLLPARWDDECHRCERRIGDHTVDGRCPD